jgi:hypothetical protein
MKRDIFKILGKLVVLIGFGLFSYWCLTPFMEWGLNLHQFRGMIILIWTWLIPVMYLMMKLKFFED